MSMKTDSKNSSTDPGLDELLMCLQDPAAYPHQPAGLEVVQTHISCVALAGDHVYKIRKPVKLGFLDFSTLQQRLDDCRREIELNRRLAPDIYLGIHSIVRKGDHLQFVSEEVEDAIEYAVVMKRLDDKRFLSHMLDDQQVTSRDIERIVEVLEPFYRNQQPGADVLERGQPQNVRDVLVSNLESTRDMVDACITSPAFKAISFFHDCWFSQRSDLLRQRVERGWIKDGHGDLRPQHINVGADKVRIYDCVEFDEKLRHVDVAADIAFLVMELDHRQTQSLSREFVSKMSQALEDDRFMNMLALYKCYRAVVRAKVEYLRSQESEVSDDQQQASWRQAQAYFHQACSYAVAPEKPAVLVVMGTVGVGKSSVATRLSEDLGWQRVSSDRLRKEMAELPLDQRPPEAIREQLYSQEMTEQVYQQLVDTASRAVENDQHVILDATFSRASHRQKLIDLLDETGADGMFLELTASEKTLKKRLKDRRHQRSVVSDARLEEFDRLLESYDPPAEVPAKMHRSISSEQAIDDAMNELYVNLIERQFE
jgi:hypothetical protein